MVIETVSFFFHLFSMHLGFGNDTTQSSDTDLDSLNVHFNY